MGANRRLEMQIIMSRSRNELKLNSFLDVYTLKDNTLSFILTQFIISKIYFAVM